MARVLQHPQLPGTTHYPIDFKMHLYVYSGLKRKTKETWMASELATILHKLDRNAEERADERVIN